jgi:hypothetical protein
MGYSWLKASWLSQMGVLELRQTNLWKIKGYIIMLRASFLLSCCCPAYKILTTCYLFNREVQSWHVRQLRIRVRLSFKQPKASGRVDFEMKPNGKKEMM